MSLRTSTEFGYVQVPSQSLIGLLPAIRQAALMGNPLRTFKLTGDKFHVSLPISRIDCTVSLYDAIVKDSPPSACKCGSIAIIAMGFSAENLGKSKARQVAYIMVTTPGR
jgi:hypothetical protein